MRPAHLFPATLWLVLASTTAQAQTIYDLATDGSAFSSSAFACPTGSCTPCTRSSTTHGPVVAFGQTGFNGQNAWGTVTGTFNARARLDGVLVPGDLLPVGSLFRSYVFLRHNFCLGFSGNDHCPGYLCGVSYQIGSLSGSLGRSGNVLIPIDLPAEEAVNGTFRFDFCNHHIVWGAGCDIVGSIDYRWRVVTPAPVRAAAAAAGDIGPLAFPGTGLTIDKSSGPAGSITATRVTGLPPTTPLPAPNAAAYPDYWEARTDLPPGGFAVDLILEYDAGRLEPGVVEQDIRIWRYDRGSGVWDELPTTIDAVAHTATARGLDRFSIFCLATDPKVVPARASSWGTLKTTYR